MSGDRLARLLDEITAEFPSYRLIRKPQSALHRAIDRALRIVSFGAIDDYLNGYHTTIGQRVYVTGNWDAMSRDRQYLVLRHERVHLRQFRRFTLPGMALAYLLLPLPVGLAWCRAHFEREAYAESIRGAAEVHGLAHVRDPAFRDHIIEQFTGPSYGWMWPFRRALERWYERVLAEITPTGV